MSLDFLGEVSYMFL